MIKYIIKKNDGIVEYYAGPLKNPVRTFTSIPTLATRYADELEANIMASALQRVNMDGTYSIRKIDVYI
jgi:hypothetical protein